MLHYDKTPEGELAITATGADVAVIYRSILAVCLEERRVLYPVKTFIEEEFREELSKPVSSVMKQ